MAHFGRLTLDDCRCFRKRQLSAAIRCGLFVIALGSDVTALRADDGSNEDRDPSRAAGSEFAFTVVSTDGKPVIGATVRPWAVGVKSGSFLLPEKRFPPLTTDREGIARISLPTGSDDRELRAFKNLQKDDINRIALEVQHPEHPTWSGYLKVGVDKQIQLVAPTTVEIRAHRLGDIAALPDLYPMLSAPTRFFDWSAVNDGLILRHIDLASDRPWRWLRVIRVTDSGPVWFSELIDLKQHDGNPISLDVAMKPAVRVVGRLSDDVPRPVKGGRVVAEIIDGSDWWTKWSWRVSAEIAADGSFALSSLPANENLQIIALCDGWVSRSPSAQEVSEYAEKFQWAGLNYQGPDPSGPVYPQLRRAGATTTDVAVPMDPTAVCEVQVVDENNQPIANAEVHFWPNQYFFNAGSNIVGEGRDSITDIRTELKSGKYEKPSLDRRYVRFSATTGPDGKAVITNLPAGELTDGAPPREKWFSVSCDGYIPIANTANPQKGLTSDEPELLVKLSPGQTTAITVQMHKLPGRSGEAPGEQKAQ
jgi:hypothetical protein